MTHSIGIVGLGLVGMALARRLRATGHAVRGFDIEASRRHELATIGADAVDTVDDALACPTVLIAVYDDAQVADVVSHRIAPGATVIDTVTGDPDFARDLSSALATHDVRYLDAPLAGSSTLIANGEALALVGGDRDTIASQRTVLADIARSATHFGAAGAGRAAKLATNLILGLNRAAFAEGLAFAERLGLDARRFADFIAASPASAAAAQSKAPRMLARSYAPESRVRQHRKDLALILDAARRCGATAALGEAHASVLDAAIGEGYGDLDNAAIIEHYRRDAGVLPH